MSTLIVACLVLLVVVSIAQFILMRQRLTKLADTTMKEALQKPALDIMERMTRLNSDAQERLERALAQNRLELQGGLMKTTASLESKFSSLEQQVGTRLEVIGKNVETKLNENLKEGFKHFEKVQLHLKEAELKLASLTTVGQSISDLNSLLKLPHLRGGFGESTLERILADFVPNGLYELQYNVNPGNTERVDAIVRMARKILPIDSKFPREAVLPLFESNDPAILESARRSLADYVRTQAKQIADKYICPEHGTTDMALLFLPSETLYFEVIRNGKLFEDIAKLKVFPVSPNTLSISLHSIVMAQEYYDMACGVEKTIEDIKKARKHFEHFDKRFQDIGKGIKKAQEAFETANTHLGHYESSVYRLIGEMANEAPVELGGETPPLVDQRGPELPS